MNTNIKTPSLHGLSVQSMDHTHKACDDEEYNSIRVYLCLSVVKKMRSFRVAGEKIILI